MFDVWLLQSCSVERSLMIQVRNSSSRQHPPSPAQTPGHGRNSPGWGTSTVLDIHSLRNNWNKVIIIWTAVTVRRPLSTGMGESLVESESHSSWGWISCRSSSSPISGPQKPFLPTRKPRIFSWSGLLTLLVWIGLATVSDHKAEDEMVIPLLVEERDFTD